MSNASTTMLTHSPPPFTPYIPPSAIHIFPLDPMDSISGVDEPQSTTKLGEQRVAGLEGRSGGEMSDKEVLRVKVLASMSGAVTTALLMTPFDVLKTRMQTSQLQSTSAFPPSSSTSASTALSERQAYEKYYKAGARNHGHGAGPSSTTYSRWTFGSPSYYASASTSSGSGAGQQYIRGRTRSTAISTGMSASGGRYANLSTFVPEGSLSGGWPQCSLEGGAGRMYSSSGGAMTLESAAGWLGAQRGSSSAAITAGRNSMLPFPLTNPFIPKTLTSSRPSPSPSTLAHLHTILSDPAAGGIKSLYKGTSAALVMSIPSAAIYMVGYEYILAGICGEGVGFTSRPQNEQVGTAGGGVGGGGGGGGGGNGLGMKPFVAGCTARVGSVVVICPMELFRTRLQAMPLPGQPYPTYSSTLTSFLTTLQTQGPTSLFRGLTNTLWRDVPFSGLYWLGVEFLRGRLRAMPGRSKGTELSVGETFGAGVASAMVASVLTQPFDVLKTRRQVLGVSHAPHASPVAGRAGGRTLGRLAYEGTLKQLVRVYQAEGAGALFAGVVPRTAKVAPACGLMIGCYEAVGGYLRGN